MVAAEHIFSCNVDSLKGKTVRRLPHVVNTYTEQVPREIMERYHRVTIAGDMLFVNGLPFLVTISRHICFRTVEALHDVKEPTLVKGIKHVRDIYKQGGFNVDWVLMDGQFEPCDITSLGLHLDDVAEDEHNREADQYIRTVKE